MSADQKRDQPIATILVWLLLFFLLGGLVLLFPTASVSGTATLPNGAIVNIMGSFSAAESSKSTRIEIGGRTFRFSETKLEVDGIEVGVVDDSVKQLSLTVDRVGVTLSSNGEKIELPD